MKHISIIIISCLCWILPTLTFGQGVIYQQYFDNFTLFSDIGWSEYNEISFDTTTNWRPAAATTAPMNTKHANFNWSPTQLNFSQSLVSPVFDASFSTGGTRLKVHSYFDDFDDANNGGLNIEISVSSDGGTTWASLYQHNDATYPASGILDEALDIDASVLNGSSQARIKFNVNGTTSFTLDNWRIDSVIVTYPPEINVGLVQFSSPLNNAIIPVNQPIIPQVEVRNGGLQTLDTISLKMYVYKSSVANTPVDSNSNIITSLFSGESVFHDFDAFTPIDTGIYIMKTIVSTQGDTYPLDDTIQTTFFSRLPLLGIYNVGSGGDFITLAAAINTLNGSPVIGNVTFILTNPVYNESPITITYQGVPGKEVTIKPAPNVSPTITATGTWAIRDSGCRYVTIDGSNQGGGTTRNLTITTTGNSALRIVAAAKYNTIKNCILKSSNVTTTTNRIVYITATTATGGPITDNVFENNQLSNGYDGFYFAGPSATSQNKRNVIRNNSIGTSSEQIRHYGIYALNEDSLLIEKNEIQNISAPSSDAVGIYLTSGNSNISVLGNYIHGVSYTGTSTSKAYGIYSSSTSPSSTNLLCLNNIISDINAPTATATSTSYNSAGMYIGTGNDNTVMFNSVYISGDQGGSTGVSYAFYNNDTAKIIANNIFANYSPGDGAKDYAIVFGTASSPLKLSNNLYYVEGTYGYIGQFKGTGTVNDKKTLQQWRDTTGLDEGSYQGNPRFASSINLHIPNNTKSLANNSGAHQEVTIEEDIDGEARDGGQPDIGADEFFGITPVSLDGGTTSVDDPGIGRNKRALTGFNPKATFQNEGIDVLYNFTVNYKIIHTPSLTVIYNVDSLVTSLDPFTSIQITFPKIDSSLVVAGNYKAVATIIPETDFDNSNDIFENNFIVKDLLAGMLTIGSAQTYSSLGNAITDLIDIGFNPVGGGVTLQFQGGTINEISPITISNILNLNTNNSLRITVSSPTTINVPGTATESFALRLLGVEGVTIDGALAGKAVSRGLTINATGANGKIGVLFDSSASLRTQKNVIKNIVITTGASQIISSSGYYGVWLKGYSASLRDSDNQVVNCEITSHGEAGIRVTKQHNLLLQNNYIHDWTQIAGNVALTGIWLRSATSSPRVLGNIITNIVNMVNAAGNSATGLTIDIGSGSNVLCANNMIAGIRAGSEGSFANVTRGIWGTTNNSDDQFYYNSINLFGEDLSTVLTSRSAAIEISSSSSNPKFYNNVIVNKMTSAETSIPHTFGYYLPLVPSGFLSDYNDIYVPGGVVAFDGQNRTVLLEWIASGRDSNSLSGDPKFLSDTDLHIRTDIRTPVESWGNQSLVGSSVETDIDGNSRFGTTNYNGNSATGSDLGVDEGDFLQAYWFDAAPVVIDSPSNGSVFRVNSVFSPRATFKNMGYKNLQNITVRFAIIRNSTADTVYGKSDNPVAVSGLNLVLEQSIQVTFTLTDPSDLAEFGTYTAVAFLEGDDNSDDILTTQFEVKGPLSGGYTVGNNGNYTSLSQALNELQILGVSSSVTYSLIDGEYNLNAPMVLETINGTSDLNRVTIVGLPSVLNVSGTAGDSAAVRLRGVSYLSLKKLSIEPQWSNARYGIWLRPSPQSSASHNIVEECSVRTAATATQSVGYIGILFDSLSGAAKDTNNRIINCDITQFGLIGIGVRKNAGAILEGNSIHDWTVQSLTTDSTLRGISLAVGSTNNIIKRNLIKNLLADVPNKSVTATGIHNDARGGSNLLCFNNMVINVRSKGTGAGTNVTRGIFGASSSNSGDKYYSNTVILTGTNSSSGASSYSAGIDISVGGNTKFYLANNNIHQSMAHSNNSAKSVAIRFSNIPTASNWTSNNNNFYWVKTNDELQSLYFVGTIGGNNYDTLPAWRTAAGSGKDVNSLQVNPMFVTADDGHIPSSLPATPMNNAGIVLAEVSNDYDGENRDGTPDIGADEVDVKNTVTGTLIRDDDANLITTNDRSPLQDWKVYLSLNNTVIDSQLTDDNGTYLFTDLTTGVYEIIEEVQSGWTPLAVLPGTGLDSSDVNTSSSMLLYISDGDIAVNNNFINAQPGIVTVRTYEDRDGKFLTTTDDREPKDWGMMIYKDSVSEASLVSSGSGESVTFAGNPGTYLVVQADSGSKWVTIGTIINGNNDATPNRKIDTVSVFAGQQTNITFVSFLRHSITIRVLEDLDGSFLASSDDRQSKQWSVRLRSADSAMTFDSTVVSDSIVIASYLPSGEYIVTQADSSGWNHLGYFINNDSSARATDTSLSISVYNGNDGTIVFVNTTVKPDSSKYRTFSQAELSAKSAKLKPKKQKKPLTGFDYPIPTGGNIRDTVLGKVIRKGAPLTFGRAFAIKDSAKKYGWVTVTKGKALEKMLPMTTAGTYFTHVKGMKDPKNSKLNNHLLGELTAFKVNILASDNGIVINTDDIQGGSNLGDLRYQDSDTTSIFHNQQLRALADFADSVLTYGKVLEQAGAVINYAMLDTIFSKVNRAFLDTIGTVMETRDTISYKPLRIRATKKLAENAEFLKRDYTIPPRQPGIALSGGGIPEAFAMEQNYPNPFNPVTMIEFSLPEDAFLTLTIYNVLGQEVMQVLENEEYGAGFEQIELDASKFSSGVYFYRVKAIGLENGKTFTAVKKMVVMK